MHYFLPGFREIVRVLQRIRDRIRNVLARRELRQAETQLGLLGWQQADFDPETQRQVDAIQDVEKEQAALNNRAAETSRQIEALTEERNHARASYEQERSAFDAERAKALAGRGEVDRAIVLLEERDPEVERRSAALAGEEKELDALYRKLLVTQPQTAQVRDDILRLHERLLAIQNERADLRPHEARLAEEIQERQQERRQFDSRIAELDGQLRAMKTGMDGREAEFAGRLRELEKQKARTEAGIDQLERAKLDPYREIGCVLADSGVAPLNQPHALARVYKLRERIAATKAAIAASLERTATEDPQLLRISLGLWAVVLVAVLLITAALL